MPQRGLRKGCWLRLWIVLRLWMSGVFQLLGTLRNKLLCTLRHLRQQLRHSLRASEIRLRRTVRTDFLLRVSAPYLNRLPNNSRAHPPSCEGLKYSPSWDGACQIASFRVRILFDFFAPRPHLFLIGPRNTCFLSSALESMSVSHHLNI